VALVTTYDVTPIPGHKLGFSVACRVTLELLDP
jgi:hypothetical protein